MLVDLDSEEGIVAYLWAGRHVRLAVVADPAGDSWKRGVKP